MKALEHKMCSIRACSAGEDTFVILSLTGNPGITVSEIKALKSTVGRGFPIGVGNDKLEVIGDDRGIMIGNDG